MVKLRLLTIIIENARFTNVKLENLQGEILGLCKDQHGCRYLQKKLEERNPEHVQMIFIETYEYVVDLMTGNGSLFQGIAFFADNTRCVRQLSMPKASRIFERRAAYRLDQQRRSEDG